MSNLIEKGFLHGNQEEVKCKLSIVSSYDDYSKAVIITESLDENIHIGDRCKYMLVKYLRIYNLEKYLTSLY